MELELGANYLQLDLGANYLELDLGANYLELDLGEKLLGTRVGGNCLELDLGANYLLRVNLSPKRECGSKRLRHPPRRANFRPRVFSTMSDPASLETS